MYRKTGFVWLLLSLFLAGCSGTISGHFTIKGSGQDTFSLTVSNNTDLTLIVNGNGYLFPPLGSGTESEEYDIHLFDLPGFYFAVASPLEDFPLFEETTDVVPEKGDRYLLTIETVEIADSATRIEYSLVPR
jgi:hypothetical protein